MRSWNSYLLFSAVAIISSSSITITFAAQPEQRTLSSPSDEINKKHQQEERSSSSSTTISTRLGAGEGSSKKSSVVQDQGVLTSSGSSNMASNQNENKNKTSWPELVGMSGSEAQKQLEAVVPAGTQIFIVPENSMVTMDYRTDRIRIFVDSNGNVAGTPKFG